MERPEARALWWPRFQRIAGWFANWEIVRRGDVSAIEAEISGEIKIQLDNERIFTLTARADRIERRGDGSFAILDYKTGQPPTGKQVRMGLSPQLTLEAAILREGGFDGIAAGASVAELGLCPAQRQQSAGRSEAAGIEDQPARRAAAARCRRRRGAQQAGKPDPRASRTRTSPTTRSICRCGRDRYGAYDDLARIKEWSAAGGMEIEEW